MPYTEKTVLFRGLDFDSGRTPNHSAGGVAGTGSTKPTNSEPNTQNSSVTKVFKESFLNNPVLLPNKESLTVKPGSS